MNRLTDKDFSFKCPMSWDAMEDSANGKFCSKCRKEVFDLTNCSTDEVRALQEKHGSLCGTIRIAQVAAVAFSLSAAACKDNGPTMGKVARTTGTPRPLPSNVIDSDTPNDSEDQPQLLGEVCPPKQDQPAQVPIEPIEPIQPPMILGKICPQPIPNEEAEPPGIKIDI
jgi:hypothetical protein